MSYQAGDVKYHLDSKSVALRTIFPEDGPFASQAWLVATPNLGASFKASADVESWPDLTTPTAPEAPEGD